VMISLRGRNMSQAMLWYQAGRKQYSWCRA
jgi:hypothetical protein